MTPTGRRLLITGAGSGIGRALAIEASHRGMQVVVCGRRAEPLSETLRLMTPGPHQSAICDIVDARSRQRLVAAVGAKWGAIDTLINNAGIIGFGPLRNIEDAEVASIVSTNLVGPICLARDCLELLRRGERPQIANMGSLLGSIPYPLFAVYSATKSGLRAFSTALRRELKPDGIAVTHISPRGIRTAGADKLADYAGPLEMRFDDPDSVARSILDGLESRRIEILPKGSERFFLTAQALAPGLVDQAIERQMRRASASGLATH